MCCAGIQNSECRLENIRSDKLMNFVARFGEVRIRALSHYLQNGIILGLSDPSLFFLHFCHRQTPIFPSPTGNFTVSPEPNPTQKTSRAHFQAPEV
jgi:hypothetical protein